MCTLGLWLAGIFGALLSFKVCCGFCLLGEYLAAAAPSAVVAACGAAATTLLPNLLSFVNVVSAVFFFTKTF